MDKRNFLKNIGIGMETVATSKAYAASLRPTPEQTEGPFYRDKNNDLTYVKGHKQKAKGQEVFIAGRVLDTSGAPIEDCLVDIWQACASGRYAHINDPNGAALDPNFQYSGLCITDSQGNYWFKTIIPGAYQATADWMRPPHIHLKASKRGFREITSQTYFDLPEFKDLNRKDRILQELSKEDQRSVVLREAKGRNGERVFPFNIVLNSI